MGKAPAEEGALAPEVKPVEAAKTAPAKAV